MIYDTFKAWEIYQGIKLHFTTKSYDYFKYHGKIKNGWDRFSKDHTKKSFTYLARKYKEEYPLFIATCFMTNPNIKWIGDCSGDEYEEAFYNVTKYTQSLTKSFSEDIDGILTVMEQNNLEFRDLFISKDNDLPIIEKLRIQGLTNIVTSVILYKLIGWVDRVNAYNPVWDESKKLLIQYTPFIKVDLKLCTNILKNKLK